MRYSACRLSEPVNLRGETSRPSISVSPRSKRMRDETGIQGCLFVPHSLDPIPPVPIFLSYRGPPSFSTAARAVVSRTGERTHHGEARVASVRERAPGNQCRIRDERSVYPSQGKMHNIRILTAAAILSNPLIATYLIRIPTLSLIRPEQPPTISDDPGASSIPQQPLSLRDFRSHSFSALPLSAVTLILKPPRPSVLSILYIGKV